MTTPVALGDCERSHAELIQALKIQITASSHTNALDAQLDLRRDRNISRETASAANASATKAFEYHAATMCRSLCDSVMATFPREVRDMIYGHLYDQHPLKITAYYFQRDAVPLEYNVSEHLWSPESLGQVMHREFCEHFFRFNTFDFASRFTHLAQFRTTDQWSIGHVPADFATNIIVGIHCRDYDFNKKKKGRPEAKKPCEGCSGCNGGWGGGGCGGHNDHWRGSESGARSCSELLVDLELLSGFSIGTNLTININPKIRPWGNDRLAQQASASDNFVPLILPQVRRLKVNGYQVHIILKGSDPSWTNFDFAQGGDLSLESSKDVLAKFKVETEERLQQWHREEELDAASETDGEMLFR